MSLFQTPDLFEIGALADHVRLEVVVVGHVDRHRDLAVGGKEHLVDLEPDDGHGPAVVLPDDVLGERARVEGLPENLGPDSKEVILGLGFRFHLDSSTFS